MPKRTDGEELTEKVMPFVCRIVADDGVAAASVRRVATEAGITPSALRVQWTSQEVLHRAAVHWVRDRLENRWPWWEKGKDADLHLQQILARLLPMDEEQVLLARAWLAFALAGVPDSPLGDLVLATHRRGASNQRTIASWARWELADRQLPGKVILPGDVKPADPENLDFAELHLLVVVVGLTSLMTRRSQPLGIDAAREWLSHLTSRHLDLQP